MGIFKDTIYVLNYIVTFGGSKELAKAKVRYELLHGEYTKQYDLAKHYQDEITNNLNKLGLALVKAKKAISKSEKLLTCIHTKVNVSDIKRLELTTKIKNFNSGYSTALGAGFGGLIGGTAALGAWALVSVLGSASTGTAIIGLSGVAATNATLAWFGGGALAAGGAGMSGGMMVLGGIVAAPMIYFATKRTYAKADKINEQYKKLSEEHIKVLNSIPVLEKNMNQTRAVTTKIVNLIEQFCTDIDLRYEVMRPYGVFSILYQKLKKLLRFNPLIKTQVKVLLEIEELTYSFLNAFSKVNQDN
ncbi:hypothetical protein [Vibrio splendidus]|uniref:hypothetical protein n=1 Tax=Vibrio splendidus TaxID=29497 RepID=UPI0015E6FAE9|nr:hypothetical protein [Vibrio splendidus]